MPNPRPKSPVDEDLQQLYNEVWAGFADETPAAPPEGDLDNIYNVYSGENHAVTEPELLLSHLPNWVAELCVSRYVRPLMLHG